MWNASKEPDGAALISQINDLGFDSVELSRDLTRNQIEQFKPHLIHTKPSSIHNFCPILPNAVQADIERDPILLSSLDINERTQALSWTIRTMELASDLEIPIVVIHLGEVTTYDRSYLMNNLYESGEREFEAFSNKVTEAMDWRERKQAKHRDAVLFSLDELNELAVRMDLFLAIENRPRYYQIPNFEEVEIFLNAFSGSNMRYWHDVGHAAIQERLGVCWSEKWMDAYKDNLIGVNLHDLKDLDEYHPPSLGDLDFHGIIRQLPADILKVLEIRHGTPDEVKEARSFVAATTNSASAPHQSHH